MRARESDILSAEPPRKAAEGDARRPFGFVELVVFIASLTALNAVAIDMMLPALSEIGADLGVASANDVQLVIVVYVFAAGVAQLFYGPLADRFGRRPVLVAALAGYVLSALLSVVASSFSLLLVARALQGATTAAGRVVGVAVVRDLYAGRRMAEVMSMAMSVFMIVPVLAPSLGQALLFLGPWRWLFALLMVYGVAVVVWTYVRLPETLPAEKRTPLNPRRVAGAFAEVLRQRTPLGYTLASMVLFSALMAYLSSAEQVFTETFGLGALFPLAFGAVALALAAASIVNARLVGRYGMRRISHAAAIAFALVNLAHAATALLGADSLFSFIALQMIAFFAAGLMMPNFSAIALEPLGHVAGVASSALGFATMSGSALIGGLIGRFYDGTTRPMAIGLALVGVATLLIVLATERGRLFRVGGGGRAGGTA
jgi:DHA1 family bicyclomycin/chloramphenicol resistance-like MFS transporter